MNGKANGQGTSLLTKENLFTLMEISMRASGSTIKLQEKEFTSIITVQNTKASG